MQNPELNTQIEELIRETASVVQTIRIYTERHPKVEEGLDRLYPLLQSLLESQPEIIIGILGKEFIFEQRALFAISRQLVKFISELAEKKIERIIFSAGITRSELSGFLGLVSLKKIELEQKGGLVRCLQETGISHVKVSRFSLAGPQKEGVHIPQSIIDMCRGDYQAVLDQSQGFFAKDFKEQSELAMAKNLLKQLTESLMRNQTLLLFFSSIKEHDECTFVHSVNASILAMVQAQSLHLEPEMLFQIGLAGFLHDAGKLEVSEDILRKPGVLDKDEFDEVMLHPQTGARYLVMHREFGELAVVVAFEHHIKFDLNGYPVLPRKRSPHFVSQIITIADVYDSLRTNRHYRKDYPPEKVYQLMQGESGKFYDPVLLQNFFRIVGVWPPGSVVQLSNGEIALVREVNPHHIDLPIVQIIYDVAGNKVTEMVILDLAKRLLEREQEQLKIVKSIYVNEEEKKKYIPAHLLGSS